MTGAVRLENQVNMKPWFVPNCYSGFALRRPVRFKFDAEDAMNIPEKSKGAEKRVEEWLKRYQLQPERFTKEELRSGCMTPDFRVFASGVLKLFCEVKAVLPTTDEATSDADPIPNRLTADIHDAYKKFNASNPSHLVPNILAFVQYDLGSGVDYLEDVYLGHWFTDDGAAYPFYQKYANGRIKEEKTIIDLYLWFDDSIDDVVDFRFTGGRLQHEIELRRIFARPARDVPHGI